MKIYRVLIGLVLLVLIVGAGFYFREGSSNLENIGSGAGSGGNEGILVQSQKVIIVDEIPSQLDGFDITDARIEGTDLVVDVTYSACENHVFNMYSTVGEGFMESNPVQTNVYFVHDAVEERCDAALRSDVYRFDLQPIIDEYRNSYGGDGAIIFNIIGFEGNQVDKAWYDPFSLYPD
jgi:hypothetical protein